MAENPIIEEAGGVLAEAALAKEASEKIEGEALTILENIIAGVGISELLTDGIIPAVGDVSKLQALLNRSIGSAIVDPMMRTSFGLNPPEEGDPAAPAWNTVRAVAGFGIVLPYALAALNLYGKRYLKGAWSEKFSELLADIPRELGFNFFLGGILETVYETAVGKPLEEYVAQQTRPQRLDFNILYRLTRQNKISRADYADRLKRIGFRDEDQELLLALDNHTLSLGEIQEAFTQGFMTADDVINYLKQQGYSDSDIQLLIKLMLIRSSSQGADFYRSVARQAAVDNTISIDQYVAILKQINVSNDSIGFDVAGVELEQQISQHNTAATLVKHNFQQGEINEQAAIASLVSLGLDSTDAANLVQTWTKEHTKNPIHLPVSRILSYEVAGILTKEQVYNMLLSIGYNTQDASLLANNPTTKEGVFKFPLNPATVASAYKDGAITIDQMVELLKKLNIDPNEVSLVTLNAELTKPKPKQKRQTAKTLDLSQVHDLYKQGLAEITYCTSKLEELGYTTQDAQLLTATWYTDLTGKLPEGWVTLS